MSELVIYDRRPEDLSKEIADTLSAIAEIAGKSIRTLFDGLSLLKPPEEFRMAIVPPLSGLNRTEGTELRPRPVFFYS